MKRQLGINLLKNRKALSEKDFLREKELFRYSIVAISGVTALLIGTLTYQLVLARKLSNIESVISQVTQDVGEHVEASAQQIYLKSRLELISSFLDVRSIAREAIQEIFSIEIPGVVVSGVSFEEDNVMSAQFTAADVLSLERVIVYLESESGVFRQAVSEGVVRTGEGRYQVQALLTLPDDGGKK